MNAKEWIDAVIRGERVSAALVIVGPYGSGRTVATRAIHAFNPMWRVSNVFVYRPSSFDPIARAVTESDIVVFEEIDELETLKNVVSDPTIIVERRCAAPVSLPIKANVIVHAEYWPFTPSDRRFITTTPFEVIAIMLEHLAR